MLLVWPRGLFLDMRLRTDSGESCSGSQRGPGALPQLRHRHASRTRLPSPLCPRPVERNVLVWEIDFPNKLQSRPRFRSRIRSRIPFLLRLPPRLRLRLLSLLQLWFRLRPRLQPLLCFLPAAPASFSPSLQLPRTAELRRRRAPRLVRSLRSCFFAAVRAGRGWCDTCATVFYAI